MKPLKNGLSFANWLLRISLMVLLIVMFSNNVLSFEYSTKAFYIAAGFVVFGCLMFVGGFLSKPNVTLISGFAISSLALYKIFLIFSASFDPSVATFLIILSISFYFLCTGNN